MCNTYQGGHVEGMAEVFIALFGDIAFAMDGGTGLMLSGGQAGMSHQGSGGISDEGGFSIGQDAGGGMLSNSGDGAEQIDLVLEQGLIGTQFRDGFLDFGQLPFQGTQHSGRGFVHHLRKIGNEALSMFSIGPLSLGGPQGIGLGNQGMELLNGHGFRPPGARVLALSKGQDDQSIDLVAFAAAQLSLGKGCDLSGIDDADLSVRILEHTGSQALAVNAGGFHAKMRDVPRIFSSGPVVELLYPTASVVETAGLLTGHGGPEFFLTDIDCDVESFLAHGNLPI